jgi:hypothetical protein
LDLQNLLKLEGLLWDKLLDLTTKIEGINKIPLLGK